jgi:hypothetical protein
MTRGCRHDGMAGSRVRVDVGMARALRAVMVHRHAKSTGRCGKHLQRRRKHQDGDEKQSGISGEHTQ